jgi:hypothetical protein
MRSGGHASTGRGCRPVVEAADVDDPIVPHGQDLPTLRRPARLVGCRCAGDFKPTRSVPAPAVTSVTTARAPVARALAHHATT